VTISMAASPVRAELTAELTAVPTWCWVRETVPISCWVRATVLTSCGEPETAPTLC